MDKDTGVKSCIFSNNEDISGDVSVALKEESKFEHIGITIELIGKISMIIFSMIIYKFDKF